MGLNLSFIISSAMRAEGVGMEEVPQLWASMHNQGTISTLTSPHFWVLGGTAESTSKNNILQMLKAQKCHLGVGGILHAHSSEGILTWLRFNNISVGMGPVGPAGTGARQKQEQSRRKQKKCEGRRTGTEQAETWKETGR